MSTPKNTRPTTEALQKLTAARRHRALADADWQTGAGPHCYRREADKMEGEAVAVLTIPEERLGQLVQAVGGETILPDPQRHFPADVVDAVAQQPPSMVSSEAAYQRLGLSIEARSLELGMDAAEAMRAKDSLERMLAQQMATAHNAVQTLAAQGLQMLDRLDRWGSDATVEACRLMNAAARMMGAYQDGLNTLARIRNGGRQVVTVQHVQVNEGGQAVVAGSLGPGGLGNGGTDETAG